MSASVAIFAIGFPMLILLVAICSTLMRIADALEAANARAPVVRSEEYGRAR